MGKKVFVAGIAAFALLGFLPMTAADEEGDIIADQLCSDAPEGVRDVFHTQPAPTLEYPDLLLTTHALCFADIGVPLDTDCTATNYSLTGWKWNSAYNAKLATSNPYGFSTTTLLNFWNAGGNEWDNAVAADIYGSTTAGGSASGIRKFDGINQHGFKKGGNYVAVTYTWSSGGNAVESDAAYNTYYAFGVNGESNKIDLGHTQTHEIGHTFGMGHTTTASVNSCQTMYPYVSYGVTIGRTLADGDLLGIEAIY